MICQKQILFHGQHWLIENSCGRHGWNIRRPLSASPSAQLHPSKSQLRFMHPGFSPSADCGDKAPREFISPGCVLLASSAGERPIHHQSVSVWISVRDVLFDLCKARRQLPVRGCLCHGSSCVSLCSKYGIADTNSITDYKTRCKGLALPRLRLETINYPEHTNTYCPIALRPLMSIRLDATKLI